MKFGTASSEEWEALSAKLKGYLSIYEEPVASLLQVNTIPDAPLCGGGKLTLCLEGDHRQLIFHITKSDFWVARLYPENLFPKFMVKPAPFCRLELTVRNAARQADGFRHVQDMSNAEIRSDLPLESGRLSVRSVALAQRDLSVFELTASEGVASVTVHLRASNDENNFFIIEGTRGGDTVWLRKEHKSFLTVNAAGVLKAMGAENVRLEYDKKITAGLSFEVHPGRPVHLLLSVKGGKDEYHHLEKAQDAVEEIDAARTSALLDAHAAWWKHYWLRSWIDIHDEKLERYYYGAQYVLGCTLDLESRVTPGLAGGWITTPNPIWGGTYTMNYNGEAPFWGLFSSNRGDFILPYARVCMDFIPTGRLLAKELKTKGMLMPVMIGPWGLSDNCDALGQKNNASLAALSLIWHYEYSRDRSFLEKFAYPFVRENIEFWEDNLVWDPDGRYIIENSAARERTPGDLNPGNDLGYLRQILRAAISFSAELGVDEDRRSKWQDYLDRLSDYPVVEVDGNLLFKEAENRMGVSGHGAGDNPVVLDHVYPGGSLDAPSGERNRIIARNTLRYLNSWNQPNAFPRIFSQAVRAQWPGEDILQRFKRRIDSGPYPTETVRRNNTLIPNDHSFEGTGAIEFINSMLANAHGGVLEVFGVWPKTRDASFERLRVKGAFLVSAEIQDGRVSSVRVVSEKGGACRMRSCWPGRAIIVRQENDNGSQMPVRAEGDAFVWEASVDAVYSITAGAEVPIQKDNPPVLLVPSIPCAAKAPRGKRDADLDIFFTPDVTTTELGCEVVFADESRRDCTQECCLASSDPGIAAVSGKRIISAAGIGRAYVNVVAEICGVQLTRRVSVCVTNHHLIRGVTASSPAKSKSHEGEIHSLECMLNGDGMSGPDVTALARSNSYGFGMYATDGDAQNAAILFDLGTVYALDEMWIWNYNCPDDNYRVLWWIGGTACGMRDVNIQYSADGERWCELRTSGYPFRLAKASGQQWMPATNLDDGSHSPVRFDGASARYVKLTAHPEIGVGNWGGEHFGLSQVRFTHLPAGQEAHRTQGNRKQ